jgi:hypothetical protein
MGRKLELGLLMFAPLFAASTLQAQFVPLEAKVRETSTRSVDGREVITVKEGNYYRSSNGSVLIQWLTVNGEKAWQGTLEDNVEPAYYQLNYKQMQAYQQVGHPEIVVEPGMYSSITADLGTDSVDGVSCRIIPIELVLPGQSLKQGGGQLCVSSQYDLQVWEDFIQPRKQDGHTKTELYNIRLRVEPDPSLFDIKSKFTIFAPKSSPAATNLPPSR